MKFTPGTLVEVHKSNIFDNKTLKYVSTLNADTLAVIIESKDLNGIDIVRVMTVTGYVGWVFAPMLGKL